MKFKVTSEEVLLKFGRVLSALQVRAFEPVEERGRLVCFHDFVGNARDFDPLAEFLATNGIAVVSADMFGRGASAYFSASGRYPVRKLAQGAAAVLDRYGRHATILGCSWGGVIALLGLSLTRIRARGFVAVDLDLDYTVDDDPVIAQALADRGRTFATEQAALEHVARNYGFDASAMNDLRHRIRSSEEGYRLNHDDAITARTPAFSGRSFDLRAILDAHAGDVLALYTGKRSAPGLRGATTIEGLLPGAALKLRTPLEHYLLLGYLIDGNSKHAVDGR